MMLKKTIYILFLLVSFFGTAQEPILKLTEIVTDSAQLFTPQEHTHLKTKLTNFETKTTSQLVLLTIRQLGNTTIEQYANRTFNENQLGQKGKDNGILIVFVKNNRKVRIETGYGIEPYITDAVASRIIRNTMIPAFKEEEYYKGLDKATDQIIEFLNHPEALEEFKVEMQTEEDKEQRTLRIISTLFLSIFVIFGGWVSFVSYRNLIEAFRGIMIGKLAVIQGFFLIIAFMLPLIFTLPFVLIPLAIICVVNGFGIQQYEYIIEEPKTSYIWWAVALFFGITILIAALKILVYGKDNFKLSLFKNDKTYLRKTFSSSGSHSFGSSSSGSSSGGFSGGGGSSGGGGASGSW